MRPLYQVSTLLAGIFAFMFAMGGSVAEAKVCPGPNQSEYEDDPYDFTYESWVKKDDKHNEHHFVRCVGNRATEQKFYVKWGRLENHIGPKKRLYVKEPRTSGEVESEKVDLLYGASLKDIKTKLIKPWGEEDYALNSPREPLFLPAQFSSDKQVFAVPRTFFTYFEFSVPVQQEGSGETLGYETVRLNVESKYSEDSESIRYSVTRLKTPTEIYDLLMWQKEAGELSALRLSVKGGILGELMREEMTVPLASQQLDNRRENLFSVNRRSSAMGQFDQHARISRSLFVFRNQSGMVVATIPVGALMFYGGLISSYRVN